MVSAVVIVKNEEKDLRGCLESLSWCSEKIVVNNKSTDKTPGIAQRMGAIVLESDEESNFSVLRNLGLKKATHEWVLFVDADEIVSESLAFEITNVVSRNLENYSGFFVPRIDTIWGKELRYGENKMYLLRLGKKDKGTWEGMVHETWKINGKTKKLKNPLMHTPHTSIGDLWDRVNYYSTIRAQELYEKGKKASGPSIVMYSFAKFVQDYIFKRGFLDGVPGFLIATSMSLHSFLVRGKLYLLWKK